MIDAVTIFFSCFHVSCIIQTHYLTLFWQRNHADFKIILKEYKAGKRPENRLMEKQT